MRLMLRLVVVWKQLLDDIGAGDSRAVCNTLVDDDLNLLPSRLLRVLLGVELRDELVVLFRFADILRYSRR